jgi:TolA-binding protein
MDRFKALRAKYPDSKLTAEVVWWLGEYYYRHNDLPLARRYFSSLIQDFPKSALVVSAYYALGSTYQDEAKYDEAIENFKQVVSQENSDLAGAAAVAIADIYVKRDDINSALATYKEVLKRHPNLTALVYPKIADIYVKIKDYPQALDLYKKSLDIVPVRQMPDIQFKIAQALQAQGNTQAAIEEYIKVTYLYAEDNSLAVKSLLRVAAIYEDKEDFKEALNIYRKIIAMNADEAKYAQERIDYIKTHVK